MELFTRFTDTVFLKENSDLQARYDALSKLLNEYPNNEAIQDEFYCVKQGLEGEKEIHYQLEKSNIGMYVLHDINIEYEGLKAQIDYVIFTRLCCYFVECKNLVGNIIVDEKGDFIREYNFNGRKVKKGMYSPLRQVEAQRDVYKKIWNTRLSSNTFINSIKRMFAESNFELYHRVLVVAANNETILNTRHAPDDIRYKVIRADSLVREIKYDLEHANKNMLSGAKETEKWANAFLSLNVIEDINYYEYYKSKFSIVDMNNNNDLRNLLIEFRKNRALEMHIPAYYVFTNEELDKLVEIMPNTIDGLESLNILSPIKIKTHGKEIIDIINKSSK